MSKPNSAISQASSYNFQDIQEMHDQKYAAECAGTSSIRPNGATRPGAGTLNLFVIGETIYALGTKDFRGKINVVMGGALEGNETYAYAATRERNEELFFTLTANKIRSFGLEESKEADVITAFNRLQRNPLFRRLQESANGDLWMGKIVASSYVRCESIANPVNVADEEKIHLHNLIEGYTLIGRSLFERRGELVEAYAKQNNLNIASDRAVITAALERRNEYNFVELSQHSEANAFFIVDVTDLNQGMSAKKNNEVMKTVDANGDIAVLQTVDEKGNPIADSRNCSMYNSLDKIRHVRNPNNGTSMLEAAVSRGNREINARNASVVSSASKSR